MRLKKFKADDLQTAAWRAAFQKVSANQVEVVPPGWFTPDEIATKLGYCRETGMQKCRELAKQGLVERKDYKVQWGQMIRPRPHYRLVNPPAGGRKRG